MAMPLRSPRDRVRDRSAEYGTIEVVPRDDFVHDFGEEYGSGQHYTGLGPTRRGKTRLTRQLLKVCVSPERKGLVLHGKIKGRDPEIPEMARDLNMRIIDEYPPDWRYGDRKRNGFILVPLTRPTNSVDEENAILATQFRHGIHSNYQNVKTETILLVDESHQAQETLKLKRDLEGPLMRGAPQCAEWNNIQRGRFVSYHCYDAPEHLIIFHDPDLSNQKRYSEIGGVDPDYIRHVTKGLKTRTIKTNGGRDTATISEALYIKRGGPYLCIVSMD
jgi:hypothetical protein